MKNCLWTLGVLTLGLFACTSPEGYVIQGEFSGFPDSSMFYLANVRSGSTLDSARLIGGKFRMEGQLPEEPCIVRLGTILNSSRVFVQSMLGNEKVTVSGDLSDFPYQVTITGSKYSDQYVDFEKRTLHLRLQQDSLLKSYRALSAAERTSPSGIQLIESFQKLYEPIDSINRDYVCRYPDTYPSLTYLGRTMFDFSKDSVRMLFDQMSPELQNSSYAMPVRTYLETESVSVGGPYLDFEAEDQNGNRVRLSNFVGKDGKYLLLDFTHRWCQPCWQAAKEMRQMVDTYSDSLRIVSFSMDNNRSDWETALQRDSVCWTSLWSDEQLKKQSVSIPYQVRGYPTFFVIDPQGVVIHKWIGFGPEFFEKNIGWLKNKP